MAELIRDVDGKKVQSAYVQAPFDVAKAQLETAGYEIITPEQFARLRISNGANHSVSINGAYPSMGNVMIPKKGIYLVRNSLVMANPIEATQDHRNSAEFYVSTADAEKALASENVRIPYSKSGIPFNRFADDPITVFVFGKTAKAYGAFLKEALKGTGVKSMPLSFDSKDYVNSKEQPFANQLWLHRLDCVDRSELGGSNRFLDCNNTVRGCVVSSHEVAKTAQKF